MKYNMELKLGELKWLASQSDTPSSAHSPAALVPDEVAASPRKEFIGFNGQLNPELRALADALNSPQGYLGIDYSGPNEAGALLLYPSKGGLLAVTPQDDGVGISWPADTDELLRSFHHRMLFTEQEADADVACGVEDLVVLGELMDEYRRVKLSAIASGSHADVPIMDVNICLEKLKDVREAPEWIRGQVVAELEAAGIELAGQELDVAGAMDNLAMLGCVTRAGSGYVLTDAWQKTADSLLMPDTTIIVSGPLDDGAKFFSTRFVKSGQRGLLRLEVAEGKGLIKACDSFDFLNMVYGAICEKDARSGESSSGVTPPPVKPAEVTEQDDERHATANDKPRKKGVGRAVLWLLLGAVAAILPGSTMIKAVILLMMLLGLLAVRNRK